VSSFRSGYHFFSLHPPLLGQHVRKGHQFISFRPCPRRFLLLKTKCQQEQVSRPPPPFFERRRRVLAHSSPTGSFTARRRTEFLTTPVTLPLILHPVIFSPLEARQPVEEPSKTLGRSAFFVSASFPLFCNQHSGAFFVTPAKRKTIHSLPSPHCAAEGPFRITW